MGAIEEEDLTGRVIVQSRHREVEITVYCQPENVKWLQALLNGSDRPVEALLEEAGFERLPESGLPS